MRQSWFERSGFIMFAVVLMSIQRLTSDLPRALQPLSLLRRHMMARCTQAERLVDLWEPPDMRACTRLTPTDAPLSASTLSGCRRRACRRRVALQWAQMYWLHACALLYAPLAPFFYGLAAVYCLFSFACTKVRGTRVAEGRSYGGTGSHGRNGRKLTSPYLTLPYTTVGVRYEIQRDGTPCAPLSPRCGRQP